eukprot:CAMPEP_0181339260 /NCGR_PEP_ID=MMETSP1101-20121128/29144_1 /TAXON_ID=46948 /ORGANISM="Rhodomonas abbreviata, Strain Caron Lab Isolate" /LENGTH=84 /DNA_ID=CAMNT_0023450183 /DNA_START=86 /DNA_END=337 /DNA_ORIENTATION=-
MPVAAVPRTHGPAIQGGVSLLTRSARSTPRPCTPLYAPPYTQAEFVFNAHDHRVVVGAHHAQALLHVLQRLEHDALSAYVQEPA